MPRQHSKTTPKWSDVKAKLAVFDHTALVSLIQDLYTAHKDNRTFLHARFGLTEDTLRPYKSTIEQWIYPDVFGRGDISISKAKKAISDYKKAIGYPDGLVDLMVYYCELATDCADEFGMQDTTYFDALVRMLEQAIKHTNALPCPEYFACKSLFLKDLEGSVALIP